MAIQNEPDAARSLLNKASQYSLLTQSGEVNLARKIEEPRLLVSGIAATLTLCYPSAFPAPLNELYQSLKRSQRGEKEEATYRVLKKLVSASKTLKGKVVSERGYVPPIILPQDFDTLKEQVYALDETDLLNDFPEDEQDDALAIYTALLTRHVTFDKKEKESHFRKETYRLAWNVLTEFENEKDTQGIGKHRVVARRMVISKDYQLEVPRLATLAEYIHNFEKAETNYSEAREIFVTRNIRLIATIAKMYLNRGLDYADLLHEGSFGLMKAAETFDYRLGNKFSSHAGILIKGAITHAIDKKSDTIRIPDNAQREMKTLRKFIAQYRSEHGRYPIEEEILDGTTFTPKALNRLQGAAKGTTSLDKSQSLGDGDDVTFGEFIERSNHDRSGLEDGKTSERPDEAHERNTRNSA